MKWLSVALLVVLVSPSLLLGAARAQTEAQTEAPTEPTVAQPVPGVERPAAPEPAALRIDDVLILNNGAQARGTLLERSATGDVVFLTALGEQRQVVGSDVRYAGPVSALPAAATEPPSVPVKVRLVSVGLPVTFYARSLNSERATQGLCKGPCTGELASGPYQLSLSFDHNDPIEVEQPVAIESDGILFGHYRSRDALRRTGLGLFAVSAILGGSLTLLAGRCDEGEGGYCKHETGYRTAGVTILTTGMLSGLVLMLLPDKADVSWLAKN